MRKKIKILLLEDNPTDVELILRELNKSALSFSHEIAQTREGFESLLEKFNPDIILSDFSLPSFDGVTAFNIKQKKASFIPFIIVSGTIGEEIAVELIKKGVTDYILKDRLFGLAQKIDRALNDAENIKVKIEADERLKAQNEKLFEIAFLQSHQVRVPVVQILGLFNLFNFENPKDSINVEVLNKLKISAESLDKVIHDIVKKTCEIEAL